MKEHPILFKGEMVRAIRQGRKTQTRRTVKVIELAADMGRPNFDKAWIDESYLNPRLGAVPCLKIPFDVGTDNETSHRHFPKWGLGDRLWVKETFGFFQNDPKFGVVYRADYEANNEEESGVEKWKPSIFMPRKFSRLTLEIWKIRVERLNHISEADAMSEGVTWRQCEDFEPVNILGPYGLCSGPARIAYQELWSSINGLESWNRNPWVWVIEFRQV